MEPVEANEETVKKLLEDSSKISAAISKIKKNRRLVPQSIDMLKKNSEMERNMTNMARNMTNGGTMGQETSMKDRRKMANRQELIKSQMKAKILDDDVKCVVLLLNGRATNNIVNLKVVEDEAKWCVDVIILGPQTFITICDSTAKISNKNLNKKASEIMNMPVYGLVSFILLDDELDPVDCLVKDFPQ